MLAWAPQSARAGRTYLVTQRDSSVIQRANAECAEPAESVISALKVLAISVSASPHKVHL